MTVDSCTRYEQQLIEALKRRIDWNREYLDHLIIAAQSDPRMVKSVDETVALLRAYEAQLEALTE